MSDALVQSAIIQNKAQAGGGFGSVPVEGGNYITITGGVQQGSTVSLSPVVGGFGAFDGVVIQYAKGDEGANGQQIDGTLASLGERTTLTTQTVLWGGETYDVKDHFKFTTANPRAGRSSSLRRQSNIEGNERNGGFGYTSARHDKTLYLSYWRRFVSDPYSVATANVKQFYIYSNGGGNETPQCLLMIPAGQDDWHFSDNNNNTVGIPPTAVYDAGNTQGWTIPEDTGWHRWEVLITLNDSGAANGTAKLWRDGILGVNLENIKWQDDSHSPAATGWDDLRLGHMDTNISNTLVDYSDYYVGSSIAGIEIGNASTWSACTHREQQIVSEANWGDQLVSSVTLDAGALGTPAGNFLYLRKADGSVFNENGEAL